MKKKYIIYFQPVIFCNRNFDLGEVHRYTSQACKELEITFVKLVIQGSSKKCSLKIHCSKKQAIQLANNLNNCYLGQYLYFSLKSM